MTNQENTAASINLNPNDYSTATSVDYNNFYCPHRLPCGYCSFMNRPCIKHDYSITWDTITNPLTINTTTTTVKEGN